MMNSWNNTQRTFRKGVTVMKHDDFMFFETFKESIDDFREVFGDTEAEKLALDVIFYGVTGERKTKEGEVNDIHNSLFKHSIKIHIDKSKERFERAVEENEKKKWKNRRSKRNEGMKFELD